MSSKIYILTGKIKSGKTTKIFKWACSQKNIGGILQPVVNGKRSIYSINEKSLIQLEINEEEKSKVGDDKIIQIGNYFFLKESFDKARKILIDCFNGNFDWLIVDEIGPMELEDKGLEPSISFILKNFENFNGNIVLVIRDKILEEVIKKYNLVGKFAYFDEMLL